MKDKQATTSSSFMKDVMFKVPLHELYNVIASCNYNANNYFCPVLVRIIDEMTLIKNENYPYLLQVWTQKGEMVFERKLREPVSNWNISGDKLIFQEKHDSSTIWVVKLFREKSPVLF